MVTAIHLTMSNKDQIATWKANRRKLVSTPLAIPFASLISPFPKGVLYCRDARLHRPGNFPSEGLWE